MTRLGFTLTAAAGALLGLLALAPPATAGTVVHRDPSGDVRVSEYTSTEPSDGWRVDPAERRADLTTFRTYYGPKTVAVTTAVRSLAGSNTSWWLRIRTSNGARYDVVRRTDRRTDGGAPEVVLARNGRPVDCDGLSVRATGSGVRALVPRSCLRSPWRLRAGVSVSVNYDPAGPTARLVEDDALGDGTTGRTPTLGPWVTAG